MPAAETRLKLAVIGSVAGLFSGLFGVGGGIVIVPLLVLLLAYDEHLATGTSLVAIVIIAAVGASLQAAYGNVDVLKGLFVGVPALGGVMAGTALQQRITARWLSGLFALFLAAVAVALLLR